MSGIIVFFFFNNYEIWLDLADFALQEQAEDNLMVAISWAWYNRSSGIALYNTPYSKMATILAFFCLHSN